MSGRLLLFVIVTALAAHLLAVPMTAHGQGDPAGAAKAAIDHASKWIVKRQNPDGGYGPCPEGGASDVGITALVVTALARSPRQLREHHGPYISRAVEYVLKHRRENGAIYDDTIPRLPNYKTNVAVWMLESLDPKKYADFIARAAEFVKGLQCDESLGYEKEKHHGYGGIGYGSAPRPDLSNTIFALSTLHSTRTLDPATREKALIFLNRVHNNCKTNDLVVRGVIGSNDDGGFMYAPMESAAGEYEAQEGLTGYSSYGSMTYAGLLGFLYADVSKDDERVQAAWKWIQKNYTLEHNPGMYTEKNPARGKQGLYYYYHFMAKALAAYGEPVIVTPDGKRHNWAKELIEHLVKLQKPEGYWQNDSERWWENIPELDTAYAMLALTMCRDFLRKNPPESAP